MNDENNKGTQGLIKEEDKTNDMNIEEYAGAEKNSNKNNKSKIIILSIIAAALIIVASVSLIVYNNPKSKIVRAFNKTDKELSSSKSFWDKMSGGSDMFLKEKETGGTKESMKINLIESNIESLSQYESMGININALVDSKNKKAALEFEGSYDESNKANVNFYTDNNKCMLNIPQVYDKWIKFDCENLQDQYNNSVLGKYGDKLPSDEISLKFFEDEDVKLATYSEIKNIIIKNYIEKNKDELKNILRDINVEKKDEWKDIAVNGANQKCREYSVFISKNEVNRFLESVYSYVKTDKQAEFTLKKLVQSMVDIDSVEKLGKNKYSKKTIDDIVSYLKENFSIDDINMKVYIDKKGRVAGVDCDTKINTENKKNVKLDFSTEYKGKENIGDDIKFVISVDDNISKTDLDLDLQKENQGAMTKNTVVGTLSNDKGVLNIDCNMAYDVTDESLNGKMKFNRDGENIILEYTGNFNFDESNNKVSYKFDTVNLEYDNDNGEEEYANFGCSYDIEPLNDEINEPEGDKLEIFKADENELVKAVFEIEQKFYQFKESANI